MISSSSTSILSINSSKTPEIWAYFLGKKCIVSKSTDYKSSSVRLFLRSSETDSFTHYSDNILDNHLHKTYGYEKDR